MIESVLLEIGMGIIDGMLADYAKSLLKRTKATHTNRIGERPPTPTQKAASKRLNAWRGSEGISEDDTTSGIEYARYILSRVQLPDARDLLVANGMPEGIVEKWIEQYHMDRLSGPQSAVCKKLLLETLTAAFRDPEYSQALTLDVVTELARNTDRFVAPRLNITQFLIARSRTHDAISQTLLRRPVNSAPFEWDLGAEKFGYDWGMELRKRISDIRERASDSGIGCRLATPTKDTSNAVALRLVRSKHFVDELGRLNGAFRKGEPTDVHRDALRDISWIRAQARFPQYQSCFPISGSWGTGKSDFAASISASTLRLGIPSITIHNDGTHNDGTSLRKTVLAQATELFGFAFSTVDNLETSLQQLDSWMLVVVEDADEWASSNLHFSRELRKMIESASTRRRLRYVITADAMSLNELLDSKDQTFWQRHGYVSDAARSDDHYLASGWFELDPFVADAQVGLRMLGTTPTGDVRSLVDFAKSPDGASTLALLCRPISGAILLSLETLTEWHGLRTEDGFLAEYWDLISRSIAATGGQAARLECLIDRLAAGFSGGQGDTLKWPQIREELLGVWPTTADLDLAEQLLQGLSSAGVVAASAQIIEIRAEIAWGSRIAASMPELRNLERSELVSLFGAWVHPICEQKHALGVYVSRSLFQKAEGSRVEPGLLRRVWKGLLRDDANNAALWLSAMMLAGDLQTVLAKDCVRFLDQKSSKSSDVFALMHWILQSPVDVWSEDRSLQVLAARYSDVGDSATGVYALRVIRSALASIDLRNKVKSESTLALLTDTDCAGIGAPAANLFVEKALMDGTSPERVFDFAVSYLFSRDSKVSEELKRKEDPGFALSLLKQCVEAVIGKSPRSSGSDFAASADYLLKGEWKKRMGRGQRRQPTGTSGSICFAVRSQSHMAIGRHFRENPDEVIDYVKQLLRKDSSDAELLSAFFIVRHSVPVYGQARVIVDRRWREVLEEIAANVERYNPKDRQRFVLPLLEENSISRYEAHK